MHVKPTSLFFLAPCTKTYLHIQLASFHSIMKCQSTRVPIPNNLDPKQLEASRIRRCFGIYHLRRFLQNKRGIVGTRAGWIWVNWVAIALCSTPWAAVFRRRPRSNPTVNDDALVPNDTVSAVNRFVCTCFLIAGVPSVGWRDRR